MRLKFRYLLDFSLFSVVSNQTDKTEIEMYLTTSKNYTFSYCIHFQASLSSLSQTNKLFSFSSL